MNKNIITYGAVIVALACFGLAILYWTHAAGALPSWVPGYQPDSAKVHFKHAIASFIVACGVGAFAWFYSAPEAK